MTLTEEMLDRPMSVARLAHKAKVIAALIVAILAWLFPRLPAGH